MTGIIKVIIRCCAGSIPACGVIFWTRYMLPAMINGRIKSLAERSLIQSQ